MYQNMIGVSMTTNRLISAVLLTIAVLNPYSAMSATTEEKLATCDAALYAKVKEAELCSLGVQLRTDEMGRLNAENATLRERGSAWYQNPFLWATLGVFVGAYVGTRAVR